MLRQYNLPMQLKLNGIAKIKVLMVCLGNICRSPLAEGVLRKLVADAKLDHMIEVDSAGTAGHTIGFRPDVRSIEVALKNGIALHHEARQLRRQDLNEFDFVLVMDHSNFENAMKLAKNDYERSKIRMITDYDQRPHKLKIVKDPYYGDLNDFINTHDQLVHCCEGWLRSLADVTTQR